MAITKRSLTIGEYVTADHGWTLASCQFSPALPDQDIIRVPGSSIPLDLSTVLTDGEPTYGTRSLTAVLECSNGTRTDRKAIIDQMINQLDGYRLEMVLPDDPSRHILGRVHVAEKYNDLAHAAVQVSATCDAWKYNNELTNATLVAQPVEPVERVVFDDPDGSTYTQQVSFTLDSAADVVTIDCWGMVDSIEVGGSRYEGSSIYSPLPDALWTEWGADEATVRSEWQAGATVRITCNSDPFVKVVVSSPGAGAQTADLVNSGRLVAVPLVEVVGGSVALEFGTQTWTLSPGRHQLPDLRLKPGSNELTYSGTGTVTFSYREAVL